MDKFSADIATEYGSKGIIVQSVLPGPVATNMSKIRKTTWMACSAKHFVESALRTVGIASHTTGYYPHAILKQVINTLEFFAPSVANRITLKTMENIRKRALKKNAAQGN